MLSELSLTAALTNISLPEWSRGDASDIGGQTDRSNGAFRKSDIEHVAIGGMELSGERDIEGKAAMGSGE
jgi:hypothetical protein